MRRRGASATVALFVAALAACGGGGSSVYFAGLDEKSARANAYAAFQAALVESTSPLRSKHMQLVGLRRDTAPDGHRAWLALFRSADDDDVRYCVWVAGETDQPGADGRYCDVRFEGEAPAPAA